MKISIRLALLLSFLALIWGTFLLTTTSTQLTSKKVLEDHAHVIMENIASSAMEQSQNYLSRAQRATQLTERLLRSQVLQHDNGSALERYFLEQLVTYPDIAGIYLATPDGDFFYVSHNNKNSVGGIRTKVISHEGGKRRVEYRWRDSRRKLVLKEADPQDNYDPRTRPWYQGALAAGGIYWTNPYIFYTSQKPGITISGPTFNADGELRGIVGVDIEIDQLSTFISRLRIGTHGRAFMLNRNRDVVAFHDVTKLRVNEGSRSGSRLVKIDEFCDKLSRAAFTALGIAQQRGSQILLRHAEYTSFRWGGENYQAMFTPFPDPQWPWIIGVYMPEDDYLGPLKQDRVNNYLITFGISLLASVLTLFLARSIANPVIGLRRYAEDIAAGDIRRPRRPHLKQGPFKEVCETAQHFDELMDKLESSRHQRQLAESNLRHKEDQYASLVANLNVGVFRIDKNGEFLSANPAFARMAGCASVDALMRHAAPELYFDLNERLELLETLKTRREVANWELRLKPLDHSEPIWVTLCCSLKGDETDYHIDGLIEDITERRHAEEMMILSERMAAVGTLASGVAHEFNNIHTGVLGYAELGSQLEDIPPRAREYFDTIRTASLRARDLTENLLSFSSRRSISMEQVDLNRTAMESCSLVEREFASSGITLQYELGELPPITMDRAQVGQVVLNFLINASHALIGCAEKRVRVTSGASAKEAWVRVDDTGCGIPQENLRRIFTPFFSTKGEHARSDSPQAAVRGTGLGLAVSHTIANNHDGRIEVESQPDHGSGFTLFLPLHAGQSPVVESRPAGQNPRPEPGPGGRILVVDDEANVRELIEQALSPRGYEVRGASDGEEGWRIVCDEGTDLVLVDMQMPKMNGQDFLGRLQRLEPHKRPLAMVVTGRAADSLERADGEEVFATLSKPFVIADLQEMVRAALLHKRDGAGA